jgi:hypothetical protein
MSFTADGDNDDDWQHLEPQHMAIAADRVRQQFASSVNGSATSSSSSATQVASSSDPTLTNLEQSFSNLVSAAGGTGSSQATLGGFLNALASDTGNATGVGNLVRTQA